MKGFILLFIIACFTFSVNLKANVMFNRYVPEEYVVIAEDILADMAEKLPKRHNMIVIGTGGGLAKRVNVLSLSFEIQGPQSKEKLREILIDCVEEFLLALNSNEKLRPHLKTYPFTSQGINIVIFVKNARRLQVLDPNIGVASARHGRIEYNTVEENPYGYKSSVEEDYDTALKIVKGQKSS